MLRRAVREVKKHCVGAEAYRPPPEESEAEGAAEALVGVRGGKMRGLSFIRAPRVSIVLRSTYGLRRGL